jgi:predicted pyridoxine 5'-phosphate oxidase superfamily flavin-nucleotide-binding protein
MNFTEEIKTSIDSSVLCWLATASKNGVPNVSPKEIFNYYKSDYIIIANIASPQTEKNIKENKNVCLSFIDILIQKGFQIKGEASIIDKKNNDFSEMENILLKMTGGKFPFQTIFKIKIDTVKQIIAPKYILFPETTEQQQIESAKRAYLLNT